MLAVKIRLAPPRRLAGFLISAISDSNSIIGSKEIQLKTKVKFTDYSINNCIFSDILKR
jgi:hypothetical protein